MLLQSIKKPFKCEKCDYGCAQTGNMKRHVAAFYEKKKPFKCEKCDSNCVCKLIMKNHVAVVHNGQ